MKYVTSVHCIDAIADTVCADATGPHSTPRHRLRGQLQVWRAARGFSGSEPQGCRHLPQAPELLLDLTTSVPRCVFLSRFPYTLLSSPSIHYTQSNPTAHIYDGTLLVDLYYPCCRHLLC